MCENADIDKKLRCLTWPCPSFSPPSTDDPTEVFNDLRGGAAPNPGASGARFGNNAANKVFSSIV